MERKKQLEAEMAQVRKESNLYVEQVESAKKFKAMEERHKKKKKDSGAGEDAEGPLVSVRSVRQRKPIAASSE